jgi:urease accessory protein
MRFLPALAVLTLAPAAAFAHTGGEHAAGLAHGFMHPLGGLDHLLAMLAVGLFAFRLGGRALWLVPAAFAGTMALGGLAGLAGLELPAVEIGIGLSVVLFGLAIAAAWTPGAAVAGAFVAFFAVFHGYAHGAELPAESAALGYVAGFLAATALLHAAGIGFGALAARHARAAGGLIALAGLALVAGIA